MGDTERDILDLIAAGQKLRAVKLAREMLGLDLMAAKEFVDGLERDGRGGGAEATGGRPSGGEHGSSVSAADGEVFDDHLDGLLRGRKKIEAIKLLRERTGLGLKEAKDAVEQRAVEIGLQTRPSKCFIATAAWGGGEQAEVMALRRFRNRVLRRVWWGRVAVAVYEVVSPPAAWVVERSGVAAWCVRGIASKLGRMLEPKAFHRGGR